MLPCQVSLCSRQTECTHVSSLASSAKARAGLKDSARKAAGEQLRSIPVPTSAGVGHTQRKQPFLRTTGLARL